MSGWSRASITFVGVLVLAGVQVGNVPIKTDDLYNFWDLFSYSLILVLFAKIYTWTPNKTNT